jgi:hypothetical protein
MISLVFWVCRYQNKSLMPTAYCLTTNLLISKNLTIYCNKMDLKIIDTVHDYILWSY